MTVMRRLRFGLRLSFRSVVAIGLGLIATPVSSGQLAGVLETVGGEKFVGSLLDSDDAHIAWTARGFLAPISLPKTGVKHVAFEPDETTDTVERPTGKWLLEMVNDDRLTVEVISIDETSVVVESERCGGLVVPRAWIRRLTSKVGPTLAYEGPNSAAEWVAPGSKASDRLAWKFSAGRLVSPRGAGSAFRDLGLSEGRAVTLRLSWTGGADFTIDVGVDAGPRKWVPIKVEAWENTIVAYRELDDRVELVEIEPIAAKDGELELTIVAGNDRVLFIDAEGSDLGSVSRPNDLGDGIGLINRGAQTGLDCVEVTRLSEDGELVRRRVIDGATVLSFDAETSVFMTDDGDRLRAEVDSIVFVPQEAAGEEPRTPTKRKKPEVELLYHDGGRLSGRYVRCRDERVTVTVPWLDTEVEAKASGLAAMNFGHWDRTIPVDHRLLLESGRHGGLLVGWSPEHEAPLWQPTLSRDVVPLDVATAHSIVLTETSEFYADPDEWPHVLFLKDGDVLSGRALAMTPESIQFQTPFSRPATIPTTNVKALELWPQKARALTRPRKVKKKNKRPQRGIFIGGGLRGRGRASSEPPGFIGKERRERLLATPRKYALRPPHHLAIARNGDVVRGRLESIDDKHLVIRSGRRNTTLPRDVVIAIVWLHPAKVNAMGDDAATADASEEDATSSEDENTTSPTAEADLVADPATVQIAVNSTMRLTLKVTAISQDGVEGRSTMLGPCSVPMEDIRALRFAMGMRSRPNFYDDWVLTPMRAPVIE